MPAAIDKIAKPAVLEIVKPQVQEDGVQDDKRRRNLKRPPTPPIRAPSSKRQLLPSPNRSTTAAQDADKLIKTLQTTKSRAESLMYMINNDPLCEWAKGEADKGALQARINSVAEKMEVQYARLVLDPKEIKNSVDPREYDRLCLDFDRDLRRPVEKLVHIVNKLNKKHVLEMQYAERATDDEKDESQVP